MNDAPQGKKSRWRKTTWLFIPVVFFAVTTFLQIRRQTTGGNANAVRDHLFVFAVVIAALIIMLFFTWAMNASSRRMANEFPGDVVLLSLSQGDAKPVLRKLIRNRTAVVGRVPIPRILGLKTDTVGVEIWGGLKNFRLIFALQWEQIVGIEVVDIKGDSSTYRGLAFTLKPPPAETNVILPLVVTGSGPFGALSLSEKKLERALVTMQNLRPTSSAI
jgi:hypothetical protein